MINMIEILTLGNRKLTINQIDRVKHLISKFIRMPVLDTRESMVA